MLPLAWCKLCLLPPCSILNEITERNNVTIFVRNVMANRIITQLENTVKYSFLTSRVPPGKRLYFTLYALYRHIIGTKQHT